MDYIEREAALAQTHEINIAEVGYRHRCIDPQAIKEIPAADVAPVRRGKWIVAGDNQPNSFDEFYACSSCRTGRVFKWHQTPYCPYCGAKME